MTVIISPLSTVWLTDNILGKLTWTKNLLGYIPEYAFSKKVRDLRISTLSKIDNGVFC